MHNPYLYSHNGLQMALSILGTMTAHLSHGNVEGGLGLAQSGGNVDAVDVAVVALREHHPVEGPAGVQRDYNYVQAMMPDRMDCLLRLQG